ncbi:MAG: hypothetical protein HC908_15285 [Calothrix sp. SM1_7_51]|nr:hypothetical protein [Calothrix sp. SM1_7_51]
MAQVFYLASPLKTCRFKENISNSRSVELLNFLLATVLLSGKLRRQNQEIS